MIYTFSHGRHNQTTEFLNFRRKFHFSALRVFPSKTLQALRETLDDCDKTFFNSTNFRRFHVLLFNLLSTRLKDQTDSTSIFNFLPLHPLNQNPSLETFRDLNDIDVEKVKNAVSNAFRQTDLDNSSETEVSPNHIFSAPHR